MSGSWPPSSINGWGLAGRLASVGAMSADWTGELAEQPDWHWRNQLRPRLDGLTDEEYFWEPVPGMW
jgi:hypothetical protein